MKLIEKILSKENVSVKSNTYNAKNPNQSHKLIWIIV